MQAQERLAEISREIEKALGGLIEKDLVTVRRTDLWVEVEIKSDILFPSGSAVPTSDAMEALMALATALQPFPNGVRVEGHTDDVPIATAQFPSNWELSTARAASVLHIFENHGVASPRLTVVGYGEQRPLADNATPEGRNANRRVMIVILAELADNPVGEAGTTGLEDLQAAPDTGEPEPDAVPAETAPETMQDEREI
jgi:chemotaxis protein MotB